MTVHPNFRRPPGKPQQTMAAKRTFRHRRGVSLSPSCYLAGGLPTARTDAVDGDGWRGLRAYG